MDAGHPEHPCPLRSNGKPLNLPAGRSYIALLSSLTGQELLVQSSTGEALVGAG